MCALTNLLLFRTLLGGIYFEALGVIYHSIFIYITYYLWFNGDNFLYIIIGTLSMAHIFHVVVLDLAFRMLLARPLIHDHWCVPSSHQCIKVTQMKGNQLLVQELKNPFMLEGAHFWEARLFMTKNVLKMACKEQVTHSFHVVVDFPTGIWAMKIFFPNAKTFKNF